jgi:hypothetical protein
MQNWTRFRTTTVIAAIALGAIGCDASTATSPQTVKERPIKQVGEVYRNYLRDTHKPPMSAKDFNRYAQMAPAGCQAVRDGSVKVFWGVALSDLSDAPSSDSADEVLAYEKQVPTEGGTVLMKNRTVRTMTAEEFKAAAKPAGATTEEVAATKTR